MVCLLIAFLVNRFIRIFIALCLCLATASSLSAEGIDREANPRSLDPARVYFVAWEEIQAAKSLEESGDLERAQDRLNEARRLFDLLAKHHKNFKPHLVADRRNKTQNAIIELRAKVAAKGAQERDQAIALLEPGDGDERNPANQASADTQTPNANSGKLVEQLKQERDAARQEAKIAKAQLEKVNPVKDRFDDMNRQLIRLQIEQKAMASALDTSRKEKIELNAEYLRSQAKIKAQADQLKKLKENHARDQKVANELIEAQVARINELEEQLAQANEESDRRALRVAQLEMQLEETSTLLKEVVVERDALRSERDQLAVLLEMNNPEEVKNLISEKVNLFTQLTRANERIAELESVESSSDKQLAAAKEEVAWLKSRLIQVQDENIAYSKQISDLNLRLRESEQILAQLKETPQQDSANTEEIALLQSVVQKLKKAQIARQLGYERLVAAAERLQIEDPEWDHVVAALKGEQVTLTEEEKLIVDVNSIDQETGETMSREFFAKGRADRQTRIAKHRQLKEDIAAHHRAAKRAFNRQQYEIAEQFYEAVLEELHPDHFQTLCNVGVVRMRLNKIEQAKDHFQTAIIYQENHPFPHLMLGVASYRLGEDDLALEALEAAQALDPANPDIYIFKASCARRKGSLKNAIAELETATKLKPDHPVALFNLAQLLAEANRWKEAGQRYDEAIESGALPDEKLATLLREHL